MEYQIPRHNLTPKQSIHEVYTEIHHAYNVLDISTFNRKNLLTLILIIIVLSLLLVKVKKGSISAKLVPTFFKKKSNKKVKKAKLILPLRVPVLDSIYTMIKFRKDGIQFLESLAEKFGNLFEVPFGPLTITILSDPAIVQKLLSSNQLAYLNRPTIYYSLFGDIFHEGLLTSENEIWASQRKMLSRSFTYKSLQTFVVFMNAHAANLTSGLIDDCTEIDNKFEIREKRINKLLSCHSFKIIAQIVMGTDNLSPEESNEVAYYFDCSKELVSDRLLNPWKYLWFLSKTREFNHVSGYLNDFFEKTTQKYKKEYEETKITSSAQQSKHSGTDSDDESVGVKPFRCMIEEMLCSGAPDQEIYQQVGTILGTGHETTVVAIKMLMLQLALNPDHQIACRDEIEKVVNGKRKTLNTNNQIKDVDSIDLTMEDLNELKYLERCILESGRLSSVVPLFLRRIDAPLKIDSDLEFPTGTNFAVANWLLHRNPEIYPNPLKFDPDRFLSENVKKRHPYSYTAFSMGPRNCIGWKVAIMQMKVTMAFIIRHFEIFSEDKLENVKLHFGITIVPERDYKISLRRRK